MSMRSFFSTQAQTPKFGARKAGKEGNQHSWDSKALFMSLPLTAVLSPTCSHTPDPRLVPSQFPPAAQCPYIRKHRVMALQDLEGRPLDTHGLLQLLCLHACHPSHSQFSVGSGVADGKKQKGCSFITP